VPPDGARPAQASGSSAPPFLVAGVGASAGGLEAFSGLLRTIPAGTPLALIMVQHLARDQPSILPELLSHASALTVVPAADGCAIEPAHAYVIPPDRRMTVSDGHLRVRPDGTPRATRGTVDSLFWSLAAEYQERAIGVVLSGSAQDGSAGIREIKAAGGLTIAQQPEQAGVDGMPRAAIATGAVDVVLPVEQIAAELVRLAGHPFFSRPEGEPPELAPEILHMDQAFRLLRRSSGIDFSSYKLPTLKRRIEKRMALHHLSSLADYVELLNRDAAELTNLQGDLLIHVTSFFREPESYQALAELVFPRLLAQQPREGGLRIWIPGCSTGEEVYSIAMVALEALGARADAIPLQIFGTDVSERAIERARGGVYGAGIAADVSAERLRRFFSRFDGGYRISKEVRERCVFARQDVTRDPPFSRLDLVVCRNVLIYLNQATQRKVLGIFHYALNPDGLLMLGGSETIGARADLFTLFAKKFQLYQKKIEGGRREPPAMAARPPARLVQQTDGAPAPAQPRPGWDVQSDANRVLLERYAPPAVVVDAELRVVRARGKTSPYLEVPSGEMTTDLMKMVHPELRHPLRGLLREARADGKTAAKAGIRLDMDGRTRSINLQVDPLRNGAERHYLVLFEEAGRAKPPRAAKPSAPVEQTELSALQQELSDTRAQMQTIIDDLGAANEELQSANEEILSSNEEMQSTNEELDTAKEELQSTNEELATLNEELRGRNDELGAVNSDLSNLLASVQIPIVMVTRDLRIRRITPAAEKVLNIIPSDIGRPIGHLKPNFVCPDLESLIAQTIDTVSIRERQVEGTDGRTFALQIRPYQTLDNRIDGAVVILFDVSNAEESAAALGVALSTGEALMPLIRDPVLLLDGAFKVRRANPAFLETFHASADGLVNRDIYDICDKQWNVPDLRRLLEEVLPRQRDFRGLSIQLRGGPAGTGRFELDAHRIESGRNREGVILLVIRKVGG
jgi:two-component system CheB/CheR fusion protein